MKKLVLLMLLVISVGALLAETSVGGTEWDNGILKWKSDDGNFK